MKFPNKRSRIRSGPAGIHWLSAAVSILVCAGGVVSALETRYVRFKQLELRAIGTTMIQLSEFEFYNGDALVPVPVEGVTNPGGNHLNAVQTPDKLVDGQTSTKWLDANGRPLIFDFGQTVTIDGYRFATANDANGRDPVSWRIEVSETGGEDDSEWTPVDQRVQYPTTTDRFTYSEKFIIAGDAAPFIRSFEITETVDDGTIAIYPARTHYAISSNGEEVGVFLEVDNAASVTITPSIGQTVTDFGVFYFVPPPSETTEYTLTATNGAFGGASTSRTLTIRSSGSGSSNHRYIRFKTTKLRSGAATGNIQLDEFEFFSEGVEVVPVAVENPGGSNAVTAGEGAINLINGDSDPVDEETGAVTRRKWYDAGNAPVIFDFGEAPVSVDSYAFTTANDFNSRDPLRWTLEGSDDGVTWTTIEAVVSHDYPTPTARFTTIPRIYLDNIAPPLPPTLTYFYAVRAPEISPSAVEFFWSASNAETLEISPDFGQIEVLDQSTGSAVFIPTAGGVYTITATSPGGTESRSLTIELVDSPPEGIDYPDFSQAGEEIALVGSSFIVNDHPQTPLPGDAFRLRLTPDVGGRLGAAWLKERVSLGGGFDTTFGFHLTTAFRGYGAEGLSFIVQNTVDGSDLLPPSENGPGSNALIVKFSTWDNNSEALVEARVNVYSGDATTLLGTADLRAFPLNPPLNATGFGALLSGPPGSAPFTARVVYVPGDLDVYVNGALVIDSLNVTLGAIGGVDAGGTATVGFAARNGGWHHASDITSWTMSATPGPGNAQPLVLLANTILPQTGFASFTWASTEGKEYRITASTDLLSWPIVLAEDIPATGTATTREVTFTPAPKLFFRVEEEEAE